MDPITMGDQARRITTGTQNHHRVPDQHNWWEEKKGKRIRWGCPGQKGTYRQFCGGKLREQAHSLWGERKAGA